MEFGLFIRKAKTFDNMKRLALYADKKDYFGIFLSDHVFSSMENLEGKFPYLESMTAMTALAMVTEKIRVGQMTLCNSFRNPAFLAKSISTLDNISKGRYELFLGAAILGGML